MMSPEAAEFAELAEVIYGAPTPDDTAAEVVRFAREALDADRGSITLRRAGSWLQTIGATDSVVEQVDALQYELK